MTTQRVLLQFPENAIDQPIIYHLVKDFDLIVNIFRAKIDPDDIGHMILDISGEEKQIKEVILTPFMLVAGDHASNDMGGDEEDSWKSILLEEGY